MFKVMALLDGDVEEVAEVVDTTAGSVPVRIYRPGRRQQRHARVVPRRRVGHRRPRVRRPHLPAHRQRRGHHRRVGRLPAGARVPVPGRGRGLLGRTAVGRERKRKATFAIGGDSAGGNLAAVVAQRAAAEGGPELALQVLVYPVTDCTLSHPSMEENAEGYLLTRDSMAWFVDNYLGVVRRPQGPGGVAALRGGPRRRRAGVRRDRGVRPAPRRGRGVRGPAAGRRRPGGADPLRRDDPRLHGPRGRDAQDGRTDRGDQHRPQ